jgi:hypothetical protein
MTSSNSPDEAVTTRIITNRQLVHEGVTFNWWAVGDDPALVTISNSLFGSLQQFTHGDPQTFALSLAKKLLNEHYARAEQIRQAERKPDEGSSASLSKPGWFENPPEDAS